MSKRRGRPPGIFKYPVIDGKKECGICHERLSIDQFNMTKNGYGKVYYRHQCKGCAALQKASWMERRWKGHYRKRELRRMKAYYAANRTQICAQRKRKTWARVIGAKA